MGTGIGLPGTGGNITKQLIEYIRDCLGDKEYKIIPNDALIILKLNIWQKRFMINELTTKKIFKINLEIGTTKYVLDDSIITVELIHINSAGIHYYQLKKNNTEKYIEIDNAENIFNGDNIELETYIRPKYNENISTTIDPIIESDYYPWLIEGVLSEYKDIYKRGMNMETILLEVRQLRNSLNKLNSAKANPIAGFKF